MNGENIYVNLHSFRLNFSSHWAPHLFAIEINIEM